MLKSSVTLDKARELVKQLLAGEQTTSAPGRGSTGSYRAPSDTRVVHELMISKQ